MWEETEKQTLDDEFFSQGFFTLQRFLFALPADYLREIQGTTDYLSEIQGTADYLSEIQGTADYLSEIFKARLTTLEEYSRHG